MARNRPDRDDEALPAASTDEPYLEPDVSAFEILWIKHRSAIVAAVVLALLAVVGAGGWIGYSQITNHAAITAFAEAKDDPDALRDVIARYPHLAVAGNASLLLADTERAAGRLDEADRVLSGFVARQPKHPFAPVARLAMAENAALRGDAAAAIEGYQTLADEYPTSFAAPVALLAKAEISLANDNRNEALRTLEVLSRLYPDSVAAESSIPLFEALVSLARPPRTPADSPTPETEAAPEPQPAPAEPGS